MAKVREGGTRVPPKTKKQVPIADYGINTRFAPGQSGNPNGRPKQDVGFLEHARKYSIKALDLLWNLAADSQIDPETRRKCIGDLVDRGQGKVVPAQSGQEEGGNRTYLVMVPKRGVEVLEHQQLIDVTPKSDDCD
jgi:hypothetical protein